jgi:uncharacterized protein (DUF885 family)
MPYKTSKDVLNGFNSILAKITPKLKTMFNVTPKTKFEIRQTEKFREASASAEYIPGTPDGKRPGIFYVPLPDPTNSMLLQEWNLFSSRSYSWTSLSGFFTAGKYQSFPSS